MKRRIGLIEMISIMLVLGIMGVGCSNGTTGGGSGTTGGASGPKIVTIKYQLTGTVATVSSLSYKNSTGGDDRFNNVTLPWEKTLSVTIEKNQVFYATLSASNTGGSLTAKIFVNGTEVESVNSSGDSYFNVVALEIIRNY